MGGPWGGTLLEDKNVGGYLVVGERPIRLEGTGSIAGTGSKHWGVKGETDQSVGVTCLPDRRRDYKMGGSWGPKK